MIKYKKKKLKVFKGELVVLSKRTIIPGITNELNSRDDLVDFKMKWKISSNEI